MKAVRLTAIGQPLALQEIPVPVVGPGDVLVRMKAAGICHSDAHYRAGTRPPARCRRRWGTRSPASSRASARR